LVGIIMARLRRRFWIHFGVLTLLAVIVEALAPLRFQPASAEMIGWGVNGLYRLVPVVSAIAVGFLPWSSSRVRTALVAGLVAMGLMVASDQFAGMAAPSAPQVAQLDGRTEPRRVAGFEEASWTRTLTDSRVLRDPAVREILPVYPPGHPRKVVLDALVKASLILTPLILVGILLGATSWVAQRAVFPRPDDSRVVGLVMAWTVAPFVSGVIISLLDRARFSVMFGGSALWMPLLVLLPFLILGALGWRMGVRHEVAL
jgi:hypothetical protein